MQKESSVVWTKPGILMTIFKNIDNIKIDVWITDMLIFKNLRYRPMWIEEWIFFNFFNLENAAYFKTVFFSLPIVVLNWFSSIL